MSNELPPPPPPPHPGLIDSATGKAMTLPIAAI
jgi:hypothetical protein